MYLRQLRVFNLRLIQQLQLSFLDDHGAPRRWTVLIGKNGTGKTSLLQAIALAAVGSLRANQLAGSTSASMRDRRHPERGVEIAALFGFGSLGDSPERGREYPGEPAPDDRVLHSYLKLDHGSGDLDGSSNWVPDPDTVSMDDSDPNPLVTARSRELPHWFVAGYGVARQLVIDPTFKSEGEKRSLTRLEPLFRPQSLLGIGFADMFDREAAERFERILSKVLTAAADLVPDIESLELRGRGGVQTAADLYTKDRFQQKLPSGSIKLPATWLSHGYQASLAWLADLIGHYLLDYPADIEPEEMEGLVLIDELDLYLHPTWQAGLVRALKQTFPRLQFIVTTHSPILLNALEPEEIIELHLDDAGHIRATHGASDPRLATGTELYSRFFGIDRLYPSELGDKLDRYGQLAVNPFRDDAQDREVQELRAYLGEQKIELMLEPVPREAAG